MTIISKLNFVHKTVSILLQNKLFSSKSSEFENEALDIHNEYRRDHGAPPLVLSKDLCKISQKWAEELARKDAMAYSLNSDYGESIYCGWSPDPSTRITARDCVDKWYSEINDFSFGQEPEILTCGHFTQIVWKDTKELGIGSAKSKSGKLYVVANYNPPGNYTGQFATKVLPPGALQFRTNNNESTPNNNLAPSPAGSNRNSRNFGEIATNLVGKLKVSADKGDTFEEECLQAHNAYRKKHGVPPLVLNKKICKYSTEWAKVLAKTGKMEHRDQSTYGENIFYAWSSDPNFTVTGAAAVDKWYSEIKLHTFGKEPTSLASGHFTQVIWESTKEMGVGVAKSSDGKTFVVANYFPPGNVIGSFAAQVPPPKK